MTKSSFKIKVRKLRGENREISAGAYLVDGMLIGERDMLRKIPV